MAVKIKPLITLFNSIKKCITETNTLPLFLTLYTAHTFSPNSLIYGGILVSMKTTASLDHITCVLFHIGGGKGGGVHKERECVLDCRSELPERTRSLLDPPCASQFSRLAGAQQRPALSPACSFLKPTGHARYCSLSHTQTHADLRTTLSHAWAAHTPTISLALIPVTVPEGSLLTMRPLQWEQHFRTIHIHTLRHGLLTLYTSSLQCIYLYIYAFELTCIPG